MPAVRSRHRNGPVLAVAVAVTIGALVLASLGALHSRHTVAIDRAAKISDSGSVIAIADSDLYGMTAPDVAQALDAATATGVNLVRIFIPWALVQATSAAKYNWANVDKVVEAATARKMQILGAINTTPTWAVPLGRPPVSGKPKSPDLYATFVEQVANRYKGRISAYEVWNEPNSVKFLNPVDPAGYTELLRAAYPRLKAVDPAITVVAAGLVSLVDWGTMAMNTVKYLTGMYAAGAKGNFDALSFHPYQASAKFSEGVTLANSPVNQLMDMRKVMIANGDADKKIWGTEYGWPSVGTGNEAKQAAFLTDMVTKWREVPYTGPLFIYTTRDRKTGSWSNEDNFGLYRSNWVAKPAQQAVSSAIAAGPEAKSPEYQRFSQLSEAEHGAPVSPVFAATPTTWAQIRTVDTLYEIAPGRIVFSPNPVAERARTVSPKALPTADFANGYQDFSAPNGLRIWYSPQTGAHSTAGAIAKAWVPDLGLALTDQIGNAMGAKATFQHGTITWAPWTGAKITRS